MSQTQIETSKPADITETTTGLHVILAVSISCMFWVLAVKPFTSYTPNLFSKYAGICFMAALAFVLCTVLTYTKLYANSLADDGVFAAVKMWSLFAGIAAIEFFVIKSSMHTGNLGTGFFNAYTITIFLIFAANILEASVTSFINRDKPEADGVTEAPEVPIVNFVNGLVLVLTLCIMYYRGHRMGTHDDSSALYMTSNLGLPFILAYTFWNALFVMELGTLPTLLNICSTLVMPIIVQYTGCGDWLHSRAISLLFFIFVLHGLGQGDADLLPMYNYNSDSAISKADKIRMTFDGPLGGLQESKGAKYTMIALSTLFSCLALFRELSYLL
jgi:hypothetical protein